LKRYFLCMVRGWQFSPQGSCLEDFIDGTDKKRIWWRMWFPFPVLPKSYFHLADLAQSSKQSAFERFFDQKQTFGRPN
jgi:hypothetical protein